MDKVYEELELLYELVRSNLYVHTERCKGKHCFITTPLKNVKPRGINPNKVMDEIAEVIDRKYNLVEAVRGDNYLMVCIKEEDVNRSIIEHNREYCLRSRFKED